MRNVVSVGLCLLTLFALAEAVEVQRLQQQAVSSVGSHATALARALKSKRARATSTKKLRGVSQDSDATEDDDDDDADDDDTEVSVDPKTGPKVGQADGSGHITLAASNAASNALYEGIKEDAKDKKEKGQLLNEKDEKDGKEQEAEEKEDKAVDAAKAEAAKAAAEAHAEAVEAKKEAKAKAKAEAAEKVRAEAEAALALAKKKQEKVDRELEMFQDEEAFDAKIATETKMMTNETQSPTLASFLGAFRTEMRKYAMPAYPAYLQNKLEVADKKVEALEAQLKAKERVAKAEKGKQKVKDVEEKKDDTEKKDDKNVTAKAKTDVEAEGADTAKEVAQKAGETWAISFFANVAMLAVVFGMASAENRTVKNYTWFLIDQVVAVFLAVMYFNAFDSLLDFHNMGVANTAVASILHALTMLVVVMGAAIALRKQEVGLAILCGAGAHIVSFSSIHAAAATQNHWVSLSYSYSACIFGLITLGFALAAVGYLMYTAKDKMGLSKDDEWMDKTTDVENDFGAMAFSVVFTMFVRFLLTGHHPVDDETEFDHTESQRTAMLVYAVVCLVVAGFVVNFCAKKAAAPDTTYAMQRVLNFCTTVASMNVAWAWLYWGEWEFFEALYPGEAVKGRVMFAITMTMLGGIGLIGLSRLRTEARGPAAKNEKKVMLTALGLVIAWSWELCFDAAVEDMCEGVAHPVSWKVCTTLGLAAIVLPVYAYYMKPITSQAEKEIGA